MVRRDQKGLYSKAVKGDIQNVVGINLSYDKPKNCELVINNSIRNNLEQKVQEILNLIKEK